MNKLFKIAGVSVAALTAAMYASSVTKTLAADITKSSDLDGFFKSASLIRQPMSI